MPELFFHLLLPLRPGCPGGYALRKVKFFMPTLRIVKDLDDYMHFLTITTLEWISVFTKEEYFEMRLFHPGSSRLRQTGAPEGFPPLFEFLGHDDVG